VEVAEEAEEAEVGVVGVARRKVEVEVGEVRRLHIAEPNS